MSAEERGASWLDALADDIPQEGEARPFDDILADAKALDQDSDPNTIDAVIKESVTLPPIQKRRVREAIKRGTGLPYGVMDEAERGASDDDEADDLALAQGLAEEIGRENVLGSSGIWR